MNVLSIIQKVNWLSLYNIFLVSPCKNDYLQLYVRCVHFDICFQCVLKIDLGMLNIFFVKGFGHFRRAPVVGEVAGLVLEYILQISDMISESWWYVSNVNEWNSNEQYHRIITCHNIICKAYVLYWSDYI